ncbi:MAG: hypothetical protein SOV56_05325 [Phascolarctobacterium sp.]|nr:hypothetical protein [Phascolarctobacterium sp.]
MIKNFIRKLIFRYKCSSDAYVEHLKKCGVQIGENVEIFCPKDTVIETLNPHLLTIGNNVSMTGPVTILNHDYSVCVLKNWTGGEILGKQKKTIIGNNVFLGWGCIVLPGALIKDNTIIGAYSVVAGELEGESVYAGNPARKLFSLADYYKKIKGSQIDDACNVYIQYKRKHGCPPSNRSISRILFLV